MELLLRGARPGPLLVQRYGKNAVGLPVGAKHEVMRANILEAALRIKRLCSRVVLPDAQPEGASAEVHGSRSDLIHQTLGETAALPVVANVKPIELDRRGSRDARRCVLSTDLRVTCERTIDLCQQRNPSRICNLPRLVLETE